MQARFFVATRFIILLTGIAFLSHCKYQEEKSLVKHVNTLIGTSNGGNTFPGAVLPWGMAHAAPHTTLKGDWSGSQYYYGQAYIYNFAQTHLSGVGCGDFGNIGMMPTSGAMFTDFYKNRSRFANEIARAGYYKVDLTSHGITAELTATKRTTLSRFTFPGGQANIVFNASQGLSPSKQAGVRITAPGKLEGWNHTGGFCEEGNQYTIYFVAEFSKPSVSSGTWKHRDEYPGSTEMDATGEDMGAYFSFDLEKGEEILVKIGVSYVSIENARLNLQAEQPDWDFKRIWNAATTEWEEQLGKIKVKGGTDEQKSTFYTALYHALIHPNVINDVNGEYPAMKSGETRVVKGRDQYTVFSLWDTYRTLHPLLTLVYPRVQTEILQTMVDHVIEGGELPFWELAADETYVMNGDPATLVVADSYFKGLRDFDIHTAYKAMKNSALDTINNRVRPMQKYFTRHNFIPYDDCGPDDRWGKPRMVSECLEYAYADWATSLVARELGDEETASYLERRSAAYKHYYDSSTGLIRPRYKDMSWFEPFYPSSYLGSWHNPGFVEGNSWQYSFFVPHDIAGLVEIMGGPEDFTSKLQQCFDEKNFTIDNEPDIAYPYLFNYIPGEEWRTREIVSRLLTSEFFDTHHGLPGNDDAGTISSWYIFSSMGFYPDCPGKPEYQMGLPLFKEVRISLDTTYYKGEEFLIQKKLKKPRDMKSVKAYLNGEIMDRPVISHEALTTGGLVRFVNE